MRHYSELHFDERLSIYRYRHEGLSLRAIGARLGRSASTISRELRRLTGQAADYAVSAAHEQAQRLRRKPRVERKLLHPPLWGSVCAQLRQGWSPQQIAGHLRSAHKGDSKACVSHETIYTAIYLVPRGSLRKELVGCMRQEHSARRPRTRGKDRRGQIPDMQSIHIRPPEVETRLIPGHWEGDLIKGAYNRSSVGTLVERTTGFVVLAKMSSASAEDALESFSKALETIPLHLRKTMTYDRGREMTYHAALTLRTGVEVFFADPHAPWQRGSNENTNGLLRQYLPKGTDLSGYSQDELNMIAYSLNTRPRKRHEYRTPLEIYNQMVDLDQKTGLTLQ